MRGPSMSLRLWIVVLVLLGGTVCLHALSHGEAVAERQPLANLPYVVGSWTGTNEPAFDSQTLKVLGVTDYSSRFYRSPKEMPVGLYIGYYSSQRTGDVIHSPKNCLPGSGWDPLHYGYTTIAVGGEVIKVNEVVVAQGLEKQLVFYWYQGRGRVVASEYWGKFWMIHDAITRNRTDGALVRLTTEIRPDDEAGAHACLQKFARILYPSLSDFIPN